MFNRPDYKWIGGGGHINHDNVKSSDENYILSAQLLNENQNITPTIFGLLSGEGIDKVSIKTKDGVSESDMYNGEEINEKLYVAQFLNNVAEYPYFMFIINFKDGNEAYYFVSNEELTEFQEGRQIYIYREQLDNLNN